MGEQDEVEYDISRLRDVNVEGWSKNDIEITVKMLLTYLRPHFCMKNIQTNYVRHKKWQISNN